MTARFCAALLCLLLFGCTSAPKSYVDEPSDGSAAREAQTLRSLPRNAAGFYRLRGVRYHSDIAAYTVAYAYSHHELENRTTLYLYPKSSQVPDLLAKHTEAIQEAYKDARVVSEDAAAVQQHDGAQSGQIRTFSYVADFNGKDQQVWSGLVVVTLPERVFVARSTSPIRQGAHARQKLIELLSALQWSE